MRKSLRTILAAMTVIAVFGFCRTDVSADENLTVTADKESCEIGDSVTVTIAAAADANSAVPPQISVEYDPNRLSFDNCSTTYGGGAGGLITISDTEASIDFTTLSGGDATVSVSAVLGEDSTESSTGEVTISVNGEDTAASMSESTESETGVEAGTIASSDGRVIQTVFPSEYMPSLFRKATTTYQGQTVECAQFEMADMTILYTTDESGNDGRFCIYNPTTGELSDFRLIEGIENRFIIVLNECEGEIPEGYTKAVLDWHGQTLTAYMNADAANGSKTLFGGLNASDFFLVYALSSEGTKGWYQYDQNEGSYQRFVQYISADGAALDESEGVEDAADEGSEGGLLDDFIPGKVQSILLIVFLGLFIILLIVVIVLAVKLSGYNEYEYMDPEEYLRASGNGPAANGQRGGNGVTAAGLVRRTMADEEDNPEEEDSAEDNEHYEGNEEDREIEDDGNIYPPEDSDEASTPEVRDVRTERASAYAGQQHEDGENDGEADDVDDYFSPRLSRREEKERLKEQKRLEKEAAREEKWRLKEEKKAAKMRAKGYEENSPMDWSTFGEGMPGDEDDRRPMGRGNLPAYMRGEEADGENEEEESSYGMQPNEESAEEETGSEENYRQNTGRLPARMNPPMSAQKEEELDRKLKEEELLKKQKRLFEQQQRIEEQRRIEEEQEEERQRQQQEEYVRSQQEPEELDEDFHFEFLNL